MRLLTWLLAGNLLFLGWSATRGGGGVDPASAEEGDGTANPVVFWELASHDAEASVAFFEQAFDWDFETIPNTIIHGVDTSDGEAGIDGGIFTLQKPKLPFLTIYIRVENIEARAGAIERSGGLVTEAPHEISPGLWICLFNDPSGVTFAMLERKKDSQ
jgi:predicted enzyme related to lactoylglutathione lyase